MIQLSICIPTYNFGKFIGQTLDSLLPQVSENVEVIVLDGGSIDNTAEIVSIRQRENPMLTYHYQSFRGGIDRDIEKVVSLAKGQYCWLFSADDIMLPGAVNKILEAIKSNDDVYICEHVLCNLQMDPIRKHPPFNKISGSRLFNLGDASQRKEYFRLARSSEAFFSFLSGPIFKKTIWDRANIPESFRNTCWIVAGHLLSMVSKGLTVNYLGETLLHKRGENDSFADRGMVNRYRIAIEAFHHVGNSVFGKFSEEAFHIRRVLQLDIPVRYLILAKLRAAENQDKEDIKVLNRLVIMHYADPSLSNWMKYALYKAALPFTIKMYFDFKNLWRKMKV
ncbi:MAG: abequosyltransferase [Candidatus Nitrotoga sp. SPKER]|nr:MAG: abequosyltransferase [Candidatus Nitrotoga sp. SPKER]